MGRPVIEMAGQVFGRLEVIGRNPQDRHGNVNWLCRCSGCSRVYVVRGSALRSGRVGKCWECDRPPPSPRPSRRKVSLRKPGPPRPRHERLEVDEIAVERAVIGDRQKLRLNIHERREALATLHRVRPDLSASQLAERVGCSRRTVERYRAKESHGA